ncbi:MAG: MarR family transcriptional regulator [Leptolyngbyaceae cyanobacterium CRU_2_3]|nr:MarR family transcriptional regulator [Leptolyngbyaceae cyanobacterium CRU_2_3]
MIPLRPSADHQTLLNLACRFPELDIMSAETCIAFLNAMADFQEAAAAYFSRYGLSMGKFTLLMQLFHADQQEITPSACADRAGVTRATITGLLDGLERDGWVKRKPIPGDRRMLRVELTKVGRERLVEMLPDHFCRTKKLTSYLTDAEKQTLIELLRKFQKGKSALLEQ